jgi:hypothetical protein
MENQIEISTFGHDLIINRFPYNIALGKIQYSGRVWFGERSKPLLLPNPSHSFVPVPVAAEAPPLVHHRRLLLHHHHHLEPRPAPLPIPCAAAGLAWPGRDSLCW